MRIETRGLCVSTKLYDGLSRFVSIYSGPVLPNDKSIGFFSFT